MASSPSIESPGLSLANAQGRVASRWQGASLVGTLFWFVVRDFLHSPWLAFNGLALLYTQLFLLGSDPARSRFFGSAYLLTVGLAAVNTMALFSRANGPHIYPILARSVSRTTYTAAIMLATWAVSIIGYLLTTLLAYLRYAPPAQTPVPEWLALSTYLNATLAVLVGATFAVALMSLLSTFVAPFWVRILVLSTISFLVMAFDPRNFPIEFLRRYVEHMPPLLAPIAGALHYATDITPDAIAIASVIVLAAYTSTLLALVLWLSTRREIVLD